MQEYMDKIQNTVLFKGFGNNEVQQALGCLQGTIRDYAKKETIFKPDEYLDSAGIILEGSVLLCKDNSAGMRFIFSELTSGEILGETALRLQQEPSGYEAVAGAGCRILFIKIKQIVRPGQATCHLRGRIIENMLTLLLENNRSVYQKLDLVSHKSLRERILYYLHLQAKKNNSPSFEIPFSRNDLADYLTVDRSALSRELQRMAQDGLIAFNRNQFELLGEGDQVNALRFKD
ncbi:Crp/Fnr family transcriptional regulator [Paenibacillus sp. MMS20-IR301]|uniref:Crp/Fnr family transcriptional regulator n=1 Tax=Paenibacillus sp. MMS20-IR301 TaxID=2895946 RepID=UPI0028E7812A|nr:Crp/Fnr family transcriptional regulator [Paenibacillus sp. MMS20-IR301]WNS45599.1 Crp/Fnr family transcriptional regulator [Paenibacillus sp. MMS20-IR301]